MTKGGLCQRANMNYAVSYIRGTCVRREGAPLSTAGKRKFFHNGWLMLARIDKKGGQHYIAHVRRRSCERSIFYNVITL